MIVVGDNMPEPLGPPPSGIAALFDVKKMEPYKYLEKHEPASLKALTSPRIVEHKSDQYEDFLECKKKKTVIVVSFCSGPWVHRGAARGGRSWRYTGGTGPILP